MPIVNTGDTNTTPEEDATVIVSDRKLYADPEFKTSTLFNKDHELDTIVRHVAGNKWTIDYFVQIKDINDVSQMPDVNVPATTLKYNRINNLIINLDTSIDQTDITSITGSGKINAGFMPYYGDPFIATLTGGREAMFVITNVTKARYNLHEIYDVTFKLLEFFDKNSLAYRDLLVKTMREYSYDRDHMYDKSAPIILDQDYKDKLDLKKTRSEIINFYFKTMVNDRRRVIIPETVTGTYIDTLLSDFIFKIVDSNEYAGMVDISRLSYDPDIRYSLFDALLARDLDMLKMVDKDIGFTTVTYNAARPAARALTYLGISFVMDRTDIVPYTPLDAVANRYVKPDGFIEPILTKDDNYIFSAAFYGQDRVGCGPMEIAVLDYLDGKLVEISELRKLVDAYIYWDTIDQYYLIPILILLIKDHTNNTYSDI